MSEAEIAEVVRRAEPSPVDGRRSMVGITKIGYPKIRAKGYRDYANQRTPGGVGIASAGSSDAAGEVAGNVLRHGPVFRYRPQDEPPSCARWPDGGEDFPATLGSTRVHKSPAEFTGVAARAAGHPVEHLATDAVSCWLSPWPIAAL